MHRADDPRATKENGIPHGDSVYQSVISGIRPVESKLAAAAQRKIDNKTKPLGSLGRLEALGVQMSLIQQDLAPELNRKSMLVFAADHGIASEGVSAYPPEVTAQMVANFLGGGAAINVLCRHNNIDFGVVDMGVKADLGSHPLLYDRKVRKGTRNFAIETAMTDEETVEAIESGMSVFLSEDEKQRIDIVGLGEMGIGNTTSASAIISCITGISAADATGRGTGIDNEGLSHKVETIKSALALHNPNAENGLAVLRTVGGYEIAGMAGAALAAASKQTAVVLDGLISTAAGLVAYLICPAIQGYLFSGHRSVERAQNAALEHMGLEPIIDFSMRLGEGTGAALSINMIEAACRIMGEMASFEDAGVSGKE